MDQQERLRPLIIRLIIAGSLVLAIANLPYIGDTSLNTVSAIGATLILLVALWEWRSGLRAERPMAVAMATLVAMWLATADPILRAFLDMQLMFGAVLWTALFPKRWRRIAILTGVGIVVLSSLEVALARTDVADEAFRAGLGGIATIGLSAIIARGANARQRALEERTALMDASGAAMIRISYEGVLRRYDELRSAGVVDIEAWFDREEERLIDMIRTIDLINFNDAALALYGLSPDEDDLHDEQLLPPEVVRAIRRELTAVWNGELVLERDYEIPLRSGVRRWLHQTWNVSIIDGRPDYRNVVITTLDVTDLKAAETALAEEIRAKDEFIASVSHELRTPLSVVLGLSSELRDRREGLTTPEVTELLEMIADESTEISHLVEDLLVGARLESDHLEVASQVIDVAAMLDGLVGSEWPLQIEGEVVAWADPARVGQILRNLLANAKRYGGPQRRVCARAAGKRVVIEVRDSGDPVPEAFRAEMFRPYRSEGVEHGLTGSVGLGLTVSRRLAELMGGGLDYFHDGESTFSLQLPAAPQESGPPPGQSAASRGPHASISRQNRP